MERFGLRPRELEAMPMGERMIYAAYVLEYERVGL